MPRRVETRFDILSDLPSLLGPKIPPHRGPFYHGTKAVLDVGSVIEPRREWYNDSFVGDKSTNMYAFATTFYDDARAYSRQPLSSNKPGYVYEVEPIQLDVYMDEDFSRVPSKGETPGEVYISPSGWRVKRLLETVPGEVE